MDTIQCAVVLAKMERFEWEVQQRLEIGMRYNVALDNLGVRRIEQRADRTSVFAQYTILIEDRESVQAQFTNVGIPTAVHYPIPLNEQPAYKHLCCVECTPVASETANRVMSLPMSPDMPEGQQLRVVEVLNR